MPGRLTFEIDDGIVTRAEVEEASVPSPDDIIAGPDRAERLAAALQRIIAVNNSFGGRVVFDDFRVGELLGGDAAEPLTALDRDATTGALSEYGTVYGPTASAMRLP